MSKTLHDDASRYTCAWYALCDREAVGWVDHPVLGPVPVCQRCADKHGMTPHD